MTKFRPMLAAAAKDLEALRYPLLASIKLDGIRCLTTDEGPVSRSLKPIPNEHIRKKMSGDLPSGLDGELGLVDQHGAMQFRQSTSAVMSPKGEPDFRFFVFDAWNVDAPFEERLMAAREITKDIPYVVPVAHRVVHCADDVRAMFDKALEDGHEGVMLRDPNGAYKHGRSTLREGGLLKTKPWKDDEAVLVDIEPLLRNDNVAKTNELGYTERSTSKEGKVAQETAGALVLNYRGQELRIGTGMTAADRKDFWQRRDQLVSQLVKFKFSTTGDYDLPRFPVFLGFRHRDDVS